MRENLVNYAINYAKHGFSIIPVNDNKRPLIKFADKPPMTVEEIKKFWKTNPFANIALKTDKFLVIDVDRHSGEADGLKSINQLHHKEWFLNTLTETTAHGGIHFYFQKPKGIEITQNIGILPSVDLKAHPNNYVVCSPSKGYKWVNNKPMKPLPKGLLELIQSKQPETTVDLTNLNYGTKRTQTTELFEMIVKGLGETGGRNDALASFLGGLLFRQVNPQIAIQLAKLANANTPDSLPENEVNRTCNSMIEKELRRRASNGGKE